MSDVWSSIADITVHLSHDANMLITVEQRVLVVFDAIASTVRGLVGLKARIGQDDN